MSAGDATKPAVTEPLLGIPQNGTIDEVELKNIETQLPTVHILSQEAWQGVTEERVETDFGPMVVCVQGDKSRPSIITFHDIGMNAVSNFQTFFNYIDMRILMEGFCVYHINAPGQEEAAPSLSDQYVYPTMDQLSVCVDSVVKHFGIKHFVGFGVGFGANILARYTLNNPSIVDALCLINCVSTQCGWLEWSYQKLNVSKLRSTKSLTQGTMDYLLWHHFGKSVELRNHDLVQVYTHYFRNKMNAQNLWKLIDTYISRSDLGILREVDPEKKKTAKTIKTNVMLITGTRCPNVEDTVVLNSRLDPGNTQWMKISDVAMVLEENPEKVAEAFRYFIQGVGYIPTMNNRKMSRSKSVCSDDATITPSSGKTSARQESITENN